MRRLLLTVCLLFSASAALAQADIIDYQGSVELLPRGSEDWLRVSRIPYRIKNGDKLRTGQQSSATILLPDTSRVQVGPGASFTLNASGDRFEALLDIGRLHAWVRKRLSQRFQVKTPTAVCSVRGTEFVLDVNGARETGVEVMEGVVSVRTLLGEELSLGDGMPMRSVRIIPDKPLDQMSRPVKDGKQTRRTAPKAAPMQTASADDGDLFAKDVRQEVALGMNKDAVQAAAAVEARRAEYQEGKTMIDVFGKRVRLEEYIVRPAADQFKFVVLNERDARFDYFYYQAQFNQALPENLSSALRYLGGKTGAAPDWFITSFETGRSNTIDTILEQGTGGHLVNAPLAQDKVFYDSETNSFVLATTGTNFWETLFDNYTYRVNGAEKFGWQPAAGANITSYDYVAGGIHTRILGGGANCGVAGCATAAPVNCTSVACENAARPSTITQPGGSANLHERVTITYAANNTSETYDFYVINDEGRLATAADFQGVTTGKTYKDTLLKFNYQQVISATEFGGRTIDIVVEPKILVKAGLIQ